MITKLVALRPGMLLGEAIRELLKHRISGAPVVSEDGRLLGMFSEFDCIRVLAEAEFHEEFALQQRTVGDLMTTDPYTIEPDFDLFHIAGAFFTHRVRRLPVLEGGRLVGQVSRRDVLRALERLDVRLQDRRRYPDYPEGREPMG